jgi:predicted ATPase/class 3 adenylate cyclase
MAASMGTDSTHAPSGVVTFLFTDVEGSTRRWEADPDAMRAALAVHDDLMRETVAAHRGWLFKHTGDGVCAAFSSPKAAVYAAVDAQRGLELPVRMGIATGEAELRGDDYFGAVLNRAARIMSAGHGEQILLDGVTAGLLIGVDLMALGVRRLRDIAKPVELFQVRATGLRSEFPPLKTLDSTPGNLRIPTTGFFGRTAELAEVQTALKAHRLVTLTGPGGVGKTRLAVEVAARLAHDFPDGVFVIELAAVTDAAAVPDAVAAVLGITQQPGMSMTESVASALQERLRLLVFDNCEHVIDVAADIVDAILARSATVAILATSREGLRLDEELLWAVPSLDIRSGPESAAAQLFVERAGTVSRDFSAAGDDETVVEICRRLDGIPLAIELAASRLVSMTVTEVRDRLDDRFRLLVGSRRRSEHHPTLHAAVQWSYDLLDDNEKALLARCSVFSGGFDLNAAVAVTDSDDEFAILDLLDALVRKSLVVADKSTANTRYSMLETIRQFAQDRLVASGDAPAVRTAHARHFAARENDVLALWDGPRQRAAYEWLAVEMANLRTAFRWAADHDDLDTAATIAHYAGVVGFWTERHEPIRWSEELIEPARVVQHRRLAQLYSLAALCFTAGRIDDAVKYAAAGQEAFTSGRFDAVRREAEASIASPYAAIGQVDRWVDWCRTVIGRHPEPHLHTRSMFIMALMMAGADDEALASSKELLTALEASDNPNLTAWALFAYGTVNRDVAPAAAYEAFRRGLRIAHESGSLLTASNIASMLIVLAIDHGEPADALDYSVMSIRYFYDSGNFYLVKNTLAALTALFDRLGHLEAAATISGFADTSFVRSGFRELVAAIAHLRDALGDDSYESVAREGQSMSNAAAVAYALEQIDRARALLATG